MLFFHLYTKKKWNKGVSSAENEFFNLYCNARPRTQSVYIPPNSQAPNRYNIAM